jgi:hypothetical protein
MPKFIVQRLYNGRNSPISRMKGYLISHIADVKANLVTSTLFEMALTQNRQLPSDIRKKIRTISDRNTASMFQRFPVFSCRIR